MANQIIFGATITPTSAPMEVTINAGATFTAGTFTTVGSQQQYTLTGVPAATYAINTVGLRAQGYASTTTFYNQTAITVAAPARATYNTTLTGSAAGPVTIASGQPGAGLTLTSPGGADVLAFNSITGGSSLPQRMNVFIGAAQVAAVDFPASYAGAAFSYTLAATGVIRAGTFANGTVTIQ